MPWGSYHPPHHPRASLLCIKHNYFHPSITRLTLFCHRTSLSPHCDNNPHPHPPRTLFLATAFSHLLTPPGSRMCLLTHTCSLSPFSTFVFSLSWLPCMAPPPPPQPTPSHPSPLYQMSLERWRVDAGRGHTTKGQGGGLGGKRGGGAISLWALCVCKIGATGLAEKHPENLKKGQGPLKSDAPLVNRGRLFKPASASRAPAGEISSSLLQRRKKRIHQS